MSGPVPGDLAGRARAWVAQDPDPLTRAEVEGLLEAGDTEGLAERFDHPLEFGTAGLRGPLGAGPARMNRAVVRRTTAGLAEYLAGRAGPPGDRPRAPTGVVVGHDARHGSAEFADDAARVLASRGVPAMVLRPALPTPLTAFAVKHLGAAAGVVVTASHNPAPDNGYKVYLEDGAQVVPPHDTAIAEAAGRLPVPTDIAIGGPFGDLLRDIDVEALLDAYRRAIGTVVGDTGPRQLTVVYTPVHGVGGAVLPGLLEQAGFGRPHMVAAQAQPDPDFPTAPFPNPEEPGVLDLALAEAASQQADLVLANDPDADRLAVAVRDPMGEGAGGSRYRVLTGDELGVLIGDHLIATTSGTDRLVATTVVSSTMLSAVAAYHGVAFALTLTGFKWIARAAQARPGHRLVFGYEEALGYAVCDAVADKDGLSAALVVADMAARAKSRGSSLCERLEELESQFGPHVTGQWSLRLSGSDAQDRLGALMGTWRSAPPAALAGHEVTAVEDLLGGQGGLPVSDVLVLRLGEKGRVVLRPSGTEPKLKVYFEAVSPPCASEDVAAARREAQQRLRELRQDVANRFEG